MKINQLIAKITNGIKEYGLRHTLRLMFFQLYADILAKRVDTGAYIRESSFSRRNYNKVKKKKLEIIVFVNFKMTKEEMNQLEYNLSLFPKDKIHLLVNRLYVKEIQENRLSQYNMIPYDKTVTKVEINEILNAQSARCFLLMTGSVSISYRTIISTCHILKKSYDLIYFDNMLQQFDNNERVFKSDFSPELLLNYNYIGNCFMVSRDVLNDCVGFCDLYDILLQCQDEKYKKGHIPQLLYIDSETVVPDYKSSLDRFFRHNHIRAESYRRDWNKGYKIVYPINNFPMVSIIIPNKDHIHELKKCVQSILTRTLYSNYEIIIVENNSIEEETFLYYKNIVKTDQRIRVIKWEGEFNYAAINNYGALNAKGQYLLLLNNDVEVITPEWIGEMLMYAQQIDIGVVGAKLLYPDNTIQHAGVIIGIGGVAGHSHKNYPADSKGYDNRLACVQNVSAVTGACMMIEKEKYCDVGGLDERLKVAFNDVDFCLRIQEKGYRNIVTPDASLYHYESKSRGVDNTLDKQKRYNQEIVCFKRRWKAMLKKGDPYYNKNLTLLKEDFTPYDV